MRVIASNEVVVEIQYSYEDIYDGFVGEGKEIAIFSFDEGEEEDLSWAEIWENEKNTHCPYGTTDYKVTKWNILGYNT